MKCVGQLSSKCTKIKKIKYKDKIDQIKYKNNIIHT